MIFSHPPLAPAPLSLLCGLGNPGREYTGNRHNAGFMAVDRIASDHAFAVSRKRFGGELREGTVAGKSLLLFKPLGYMNTSGVALSQLAQFYKIPPSEIAVFYDELDLPLGKIRVKKGGGNGGHNGLKSIDSYLGRDYWRVRIGIDHPGDKEAVVSHVLSDFRKEEKPVIDRLLAQLSSHVELLITGSHSELMNRVTLAMR